MCMDSNAYKLIGKRKEVTRLVTQWEIGTRGKFHSNCFYPILTRVMSLSSCRLYIRRYIDLLICSSSCSRVSDEIIVSGFQPLFQFPSSHCFIEASFTRRLHCLNVCKERDKHDQWNYSNQYRNLYIYLNANIWKGMYLLFSLFPVRSLFTGIQRIRQTDRARSDGAIRKRSWKR